MGRGLQFFNIRDETQIDLSGECLEQLHVCVSLHSEAKQTKTLEFGAEKDFF